MAKDDALLPDRTCFWWVHREDRPRCSFLLDARKEEQVVASGAAGSMMRRGSIFFAVVGDHLCAFYSLPLPKHAATTTTTTSSTSAGDSI